MHTAVATGQPFFSDWLDLPTHANAIMGLEAASLDLPETPGADSGASLFPQTWGWRANLQETFRHSGWAAERRRRAQALEKAFGCGPSLVAFCACGSRRWILRKKDDDNAFKAVPDTCRSPWCKPCYRSRSYVIRDRLAAKLDERPVRFVTLTLRPDDNSLQFALDRLYQGFRRLRQRPVWKKRVTGGVAFLEVKIGRGSGKWHPHLHVLVQGRYLPQPDLAREWLAVTGDSHVVDVRLVRSKRQVLAYVTDYCTKVADLKCTHAAGGQPPADLDDIDELVEAMRALKGRRRIITFGEWRTWRLLRHEPLGEWEVYMHEAEILFKQGDGDSLVLAIAELLAPTPDGQSLEFHVFDSS